MPIDFQSYILSSSPPGFELNAYCAESFLKQNGFNGFHSQKSDSKTQLTTSWTDSTLLGAFGGTEEKGSLTITDARNVERILNWQEIYEKCTTADTTSSSPLPLRRNKSEASKMGKKKVSFADDLGLALESVRFMTESSNTPPTLQPELLARISPGSSSTTVEPVTLLFGFAQPASDYLSLRNKVEANKVSLENATARGRSLVGTVRVKNISFEKRVFVRFTVDNWETHNDADATYVPAAAGYGSQTLFDTFAFEVAFPPSSMGTEKLQFAICYQAGGQEFWDSNNSENYEVIPAAHEATTYGPTFCEKVVFSLQREDSWTDFSGWDGIDSHDPYW